MDFTSTCRLLFELKITDAFVPHFELQRFDGRLLCIQRHIESCESCEIIQLFILCSTKYLRCFLPISSVCLNIEIKEKCFGNNKNVLFLYSNYNKCMPFCGLSTLNVCNFLDYPYQMYAILWIIHIKCMQFCGLSISNVCNSVDYLHQMDVIL